MSDPKEAVMIGFRRFLALAGTVFLLAACASGTGNPLGGSTTTAVPGQPGGTTDSTQPGDTTVPGDTTTTTADAPISRPLPLREGLGTFDTYEWNMELRTLGPSADESSHIFTVWLFARDPESRFSRVTTTQTGPDFDGEETSVVEITQVEGETCQWDEESWTRTSATDQERDVLDAVQRNIDTTIVPDNPVLVGTEAIAGIPATHWRYSVSGFGTTSGALVTENQVDYWVADDSGVLLRYEMILESRSGPSTDPAATVYRVEARAVLMAANEPITLTLHPDCLATPAD